MQSLLKKNQELKTKNNYLSKQVQHISKALRYNQQPLVNPAWVELRKPIFNSHKKNIAKYSVMNQNKKGRYKSQEKQFQDEQIKSYNRRVATSQDILLNNPYKKLTHSSVIQSPYCPNVSHLPNSKDYANLSKVRLLISKSKSKDDSSVQSDLPIQVRNNKNVWKQARRYLSEPKKMTGSGQGNIRARKKIYSHHENFTAMEKYSATPKNSSRNKIDHQQSLNKKESQQKIYPPSLYLKKQRESEQRLKQKNKTLQKDDQICMEMYLKIEKQSSKLQSESSCFLRIFKHYGNLYQIYAIATKDYGEVCPRKWSNGKKMKVFMRNINSIKKNNIKINHKTTMDDIISAVRIYVLEEQGDSAELQQLYYFPSNNNSSSQKDFEAHPIVRQILFLQKLTIILLVDALINNKYSQIEKSILKILQLLLCFYGDVYRDFRRLQSQSTDLVIIDKAALSLILTTQQLQNLESFSFSLSNNQPHNLFATYILLLQSQLKQNLKALKSLQNFFQKYMVSCKQYPINFMYYKLLQYYSIQLLGHDWSKHGIQFLETCPSPYLHHINHQRKFTLVLDLDQTLIHYKTYPQNTRRKINNKIGQFLMRPNLFQFLQILAEHYQIGIFTCALPDYADLIINRLPKIDFRLYRHHTIRLQNEYAKDLSRIGRNLSHMLIIDNLQRNFRLQRLNGIKIKSWYGQKNDQILLKIAQQLVNVAKKAETMQKPDLRHINFIRDFH